MGMRTLGILGLWVVLMTSCATESAEPSEGEPFVEHGESSDFTPVPSGKQDGTAAIFDRNTIVSEDYFLNANMVDGDGLQAFLEDTPYGRRCWLADEILEGRRAADVIVDEAQLHGLNPMLLVTRLQVEASIISASTRPSQFKIDRALGCGCFDGEACQGKFLGLTHQLDCAAKTLAERHAQSVSGDGAWQKGVSKRTLDPLGVRPGNHGTAALYAYTPWVLEGRGGNWLVWNITERFQRHLEGLNLVERVIPTWIGSPCATHEDCTYDDAVCLPYAVDDATSAGLCSQPCEGFCPDRFGFAETFCTPFPAQEGGWCLSSPASENNQCADLAGTSPTSADRFVGNSTAPAATSEVCLP